MGEALRQIRRKKRHQRLDEENIELRAQLSGLTTVLGKMHGVILRFSLGVNWAQQGYRRLWPWRKKSDMVPVYTWVGAGNPEKAAQDTMVACFGKDFKERAAEALAEVRKAQEEKDASTNPFFKDASFADSVRRGK